MKIERYADDFDEISSYDLPDLTELELQVDFDGMEESDIEFYCEHFQDHLIALMAEMKVPKLKHLFVNIFGGYAHSNFDFSNLRNGALGHISVYIRDVCDHYLHVFSCKSQ